MSKSDAASGAAADQFDVDVMILGEAIAKRLYQLNERTMAVAVGNAMAKMDTPGLYGQAVLDIVNGCADDQVVQLREKLRLLLERGI